MTKAFPGIVLLVLAASPASTQDWRAQLKADAVVIRGAKMIYDEVGLYKLTWRGTNLRRFKSRSTVKRLRAA